MKTMQLDDKIVRVSDSEGANLFLEGWKYVAKSVWKEKVRDIEQPEEEKPTTDKNNKMSKSQKRHLRKQKKMEK